MPRLRSVSPAHLSCRIYSRKRWRFTYYSILTGGGGVAAVLINKKVIIIIKVVGVVVLVIISLKTNAQSKQSYF